MIEAESIITHVDVYLDRARVTRQVVVALDAGHHRVAITKLPLTLIRESVRVSAQGTVPARLHGVDVQRAFYIETPAEQVRALEEHIEALQDDLQRLEAQMSLAREEQAGLKALGGETKTFARGLATGRLTPEAHLAMVETLNGRVAALNAALIEMGAHRRVLERQLQKEQRELAQWRSTRAPERFTAFVEVALEAAGELTLALHYVVLGARWDALYDFRLVEGDEAGLDITYLAQVSQQSGEAWENVTLTLSTARPALTGILPELDPWYIAPVVMPRPPAAPSRGRFEAPGGMAVGQGAAMPMDADMLLEEAEERQVYQATAVTATVQERGVGVNYQVATPVTVPDDGGPHKVTVAEFRLWPELDYVTAPKVTPTVYRRARVLNRSGYTLLPGGVDLFDSDEFLGSTRLELTAPEGEIVLYLGAEDRLQVKRELMRREVNKRLITAKRDLHYGYALTLENLLPRAVRVTVEDQIPVSRHEEIRVKLEGAVPQPAEVSELHRLVWRFTVPPRGKEVIRFDFSVEYPQRLEVAGLP